MLAAGHSSKPDRALDTALLATRAHPAEPDPAQRVDSELVRPHPDAHRDYPDGVKHGTDHRTIEHVCPEVEAWDRARDPMPWWWFLPRRVWVATRRWRHDART